jgi:predicted PurR-regulated permease PerM
VTTRSDAGALLLKSTLAAAGLVLAASLLWLLRSLIVPVAVSGLLAYVCRPLVTGLERYRLPRALAVAALLIAFVVVVAGAVGGARAVMPTELGIIQFKVRLLYALNERYETLMGLDRSLTRGNRIYQWLHADLDPFVDNAAELLSLSADERAKLLASRDGAATPAVSDAILSEDRANAQTLEKRARASRAAPDERRSPQAARGGLSTSLSFARSGTLIEALSVWLIAPLVFLFLIRDRGEIKHGLLSLVPNALFEPALTVMSDVDDAAATFDEVQRMSFSEAGREDRRRARRAGSALRAPSCRGARMPVRVVRRSLGGCNGAHAPRVGCARTPGRQRPDSFGRDGRPHAG